LAAPALRQPLAASQVVGATPSWSEPRLSGGRLFWQERRTAEGGRTALLCRPLDDLSGPAPAPLEISPPEADLGSRTHNYGGGVVALGDDSAGGTRVVWVNDRDRALWSLALPPLDDPGGSRGSGEVVAPGAPAQQASSGTAIDPGSAEDPRRLTSADPARRYADGLIDGPRQRWIGVLEEGEAEALVAVPLAGGEPQPLRQAADFIGYAVLSPSGSHLAWVEWQRPWMPWERSELWLGRIGDAGELLEARRIAGSGAGDGEGISLFQPLWIPRAEGPADLVVANDCSGWWNLEWLPGAEALAAGEEPRWQALLTLPAEFALPQWVYGMRSTAWDGEALVAMACRDGRWELGRLSLPGRRPAIEELPEPPSPPNQDVSEGQHKGQSEAQGEGQRKRQREIEAEGEGQSEGTPAPTVEAEAGLAPAAGPHWRPLDLPFDDLAAVVAEAGRVVAVAASATEPAGLLELDTATGRWRHTPASPRPLPIEAISTPEPISFAGHGGLATQAWYYPPAGGGDRRSPLLVRAHSGPTGMARTGLSLAIQFWTSRGWGVVDINYGGSTGFGRAYRERLQGGWGLVDTADCAAAARALVASGRADPQRIAMEGGSAAGFTVLALLCQDTVLKAGACRYAVADLEAMAQHTHRFEARYLDGLIGPWPEAAALYRERSPLHNAERIKAPLIFFQGLDDRVVPPDQTERMALALSERGVPMEVHLFPGEGHGFRDGAVQRRVLEATEAFFRRHFALG